MLAQTRLMQPLVEVPNPVVPERAWTMGANQTLSDADVSMRRNIFEFQRMRSPDYRLKVPVAIREMLRDVSDLAAYRISVSYLIGGSTVQMPSFLICRAAQKDEVLLRIQRLASGGFSGLLDPLRIRDAMHGDEPLVGWLEANNGFFLFVDEEPWGNTFKLFTGRNPPAQT